jgi:hypothetical protein
MDRLYQATILTPPGTTAALPLTSNLPLEDAELVSVTILIPDGHAGLTGIRILQAGKEIVPWSNDDWLISNDEIVTVPIGNQITAVGLQIQTYNTDAFPHKHWVRALINDLNTSAAQTAAATPFIPSAVLSGP